MKMVTITNTISKEEYEQALEKGAMSLITSPALLWGYGVCGARVHKDDDGHYYLTYERGETCD